MQLKLIQCYLSSSSINLSRYDIWKIHSPINMVKKILPLLKCHLSSSSSITCHLTQDATKKMTKVDGGQTAHLKPLPPAHLLCSNKTTSNQQNNHSPPTRHSHNSYALKPVLPSQTSIRPSQLQAVGNIDTAAFYNLKVR